MPGMTPIRARDMAAILSTEWTINHFKSSTVQLEPQLLQNEAQELLHHPRLSWSFSHSSLLFPQIPKCDFWAGAFTPTQ